MRLNDLNNKEIKKISKEIAPKLITHPAFMFYCKNEKNRQNFIEDYFNYYLNKWNKRKEIILADENFDVIISLIDFASYRDKGKSLGASKLKKYKNPYANISYHKGNVAYLTNIVAPENINTKIMTIYSTVKYANAVDKLVDEATRLAEENEFMIVYETFSKKAVEIINKKGFEIAYEKQFSGTQYFETVMTYYKHDMAKPVELVKDFKPIIIEDDIVPTNENSEEENDEKTPN